MAEKDPKPAVSPGQVAAAVGRRPAGKKRPGFPDKRDTQAPLRAIRLITEPDGRQRDQHPNLATRAARVAHARELLALGLVDDHTVKDLATDWALNTKETGRILGEAQRQLDAFGEKDFTLKLVQERLGTWILEGDRDRVKAAELLLRSAGALTERVEHTHQMAELSDEQVTQKAVEELVASPQTRELLRSELAKWDAGQTTKVEVLSCLPLTDDEEEDSE